jgi:hypothetical protein
MRVSIACGELLRQRSFQCSNPTEDIQDGTPQAIELILDAQLSCLIDWFKGSQHPYDGISERRREKWTSYCFEEKWVYYATDVISRHVKWSTDDDSSCSFVRLPASGGHIPSTCHVQITWIMSLAERWNATAASNDLAPINLVAFASVEHWWFGYQRGNAPDLVTVQMTFDQSEQGGKLIANRLESTEEFDDFSSVLYHNTLLRSLSESEKLGDYMVPLNSVDLSFLLAAKLVESFAEEWGRVNQATEELRPELQAALRAVIWQCWRFMRSLRVSDCIDATCAWSIAAVLRNGVEVDVEQPWPYANEFEAYKAALRSNEDNYVIRRCLVEALVDIGEHYLAHQHCLRLIEQLAPFVSEDCADAPAAIVAHDYAAELLDTTLAEIHRLHLREDEGYERVDEIPGVGSRVDVEWAVGEELVLYPGVVRVHPDSRSFCIAYEDDEAPGQHRRRFENSLHLVNLNDPQDQYLERYYLSDETPVDDADAPGTVPESAAAGGVSSDKMQQSKPP